MGQLFKPLKLINLLKANKLEFNGLYFKFYGVFALIMVMLFINTAYASCERHIYNDSNQTWVIKIINANGNVYFENSVCPVNGPCSLKAKSNLKIKYTSTSGASNGLMVFTDYKAKAGLYNYGYDGNCPTFDNDIEPGVAKFDNPAGDVRIVLDEWSDIYNQYYMD